MTMPWLGSAWRSTLDPERAVVYTWNADENAHMLAINVALGFRRCGLEAVWQRAGDGLNPPFADAASGAAGTAGSGARSDS